MCPRYYRMVRYQVPVHTHDLHSPRAVPGNTGIQPIGDFAPPNMKRSPDEELAKIMEGIKRNQEKMAEVEAEMKVRASQKEFIQRKLYEELTEQQLHHWQRHYQYSQEDMEYSQHDMEYLHHDMEYLQNDLTDWQKKEESCRKRKLSS